MRYPRPPRMPILRFGCLGFFVVGWMFYATFLMILMCWLIGLFCAALIELLFSIVKIVNRQTARKKREKALREYRSAAATWRRP